MRVPPRELRAGPIRWGNGPPLPAGARTFESRAWYRFSDARRLRALRRFVEQEAMNPAFRAWVVNAVLVPSGAQQRDYEAQARALLAWVQENIYYTNEPGEQIQAPWVTVRWRTGDCDDLAVLLAAMAESIRLPWRFVLAGRDRAGVPVRWHEPVYGGGSRRPPRGVKFSHIYVDLGWPPFRPVKWVAAEPTVKGAPLGHDTVLHGPLQDRHLRGRLSAVFPELAGLEGTNAAAAEVEVEPGYSLIPTPRDLWDAILEAVSWRGILVGVLQSILIGYVMNWFYQRRRRRR